MLVRGSIAFLLTEQAQDSPPALACCCPGCAPAACPTLLASRCLPALPFSGEFFPGIPKIQYEGPDSTNPLAFRYYNASEEILGKPMREWWVGSTWACALVVAVAAHRQPCWIVMRVYLVEGSLSDLGSC